MLTASPPSRQNQAVPPRAVCLLPTPPPPARTRTEPSTPEARLRARPTPADVTRRTGTARTRPRARPERPCRGGGSRLVRNATPTDSRRRNNACPSRSRSRVHTAAPVSGRTMRSPRRGVAWLVGRQRLDVGKRRTVLVTDPKAGELIRAALPHFDVADVGLMRQ